MNPNSTDGVKVTVPSGSGITIHEAKVWWSVPHSSSGSNTFALVNSSAGGIGEANTPYVGGPDTWVLPSTTTSLMLSDYCSSDHSGAACSFSGGFAPNLEMKGSQLTLAESVPPKGSTTGGGLTTSNTLTGTQSLGYATEDTASGVRLVDLLIDGAVVASKDYIAVCPYSNFAACPASESDSVSWNTATVADGSHTVQLKVQDAAGNTSTIYNGTVTTHNPPTNTSIPAILAPAQLVVGSVVTAQPGSWSEPSGAGSITYAYQWQDCDSEGNNCHAIPGAQSTSYTAAPSDVGHTLRVLVEATDSDGTSSATSNPSVSVLSSSGSLGAPNGPGGSSPNSPTTGGNNGGGGSQGGGGGGSVSPGSFLIGIGAPNGLSASEATVVHIGIARTMTRPYAKRAFKFSGRLMNLGGVVIAGASLDILETVAGTSRQRVIGHTKTSSAGTFTASIPAGPSRTIEIAYRAFSGDPGYATVATVIESVEAGTQLHVTPRQIASTGTILITGKVLGGVPRHGAIVQALVKYRGRWRPLERNSRTNSHGKFTVAYQFQGAHGHFPVRVEVPAGQAGFPYARGYSKTTYVTSH